MSFNPKEHLIDLKGKDYLPVAYRLVWFRDEHPNGAVRTEVVSMNPLLVKATVLDENGRFLSDGHASATLPNGRTAVWSGREFEKAETAAIGRALGHAGYGTQFDAEDEGDYLADSPVEPPAKSAVMKQEDGAPGYNSAAAITELLKHYGKRFTRKDIESALGKIDTADLTTEQAVLVFKDKVATADAKRNGENDAPKA
jgi:hypothetical protein